jgi:glycosyltransferase involved in cell wall biosynthesis
VNSLPEPFLSLIVPAYDEEGRLPDTLAQIFDFLGQQAYSSEVLVVENGSQDRTYQVALEFSAGLNKRAAECPDKQEPSLRLLRTAGRGKGLAVQQGMLEARGAYRFMCDADLSMPIDQVNRFIPPLLQDCDISIASREAPGSRRINEPAYRHIVGRIFNLLIRLLALPNLQDTQCGFKCFRAEVAKDLFPRMTITGWSFDVEILFIATRRGYHIKEVPIPWYFNPHSHISVVRDSVRMGWDILQVRLNHLRGRYDQSS